jgi:hypothetical protein
MLRTTHRFVRPARAAAFFCVVTLVACSNPAAETPPPVTTSASAVTTSSAPPATLKGAVEAYTVALGHGDWRNAWKIVSTRCQRSLGRAAFRASVGGSSVQNPDLHLVRYSESINGAKAHVSYQVSDRERPRRVEDWVLEDGVWRFDNC